MKKLLSVAAVGSIFLFAHQAFAQMQYYNNYQYIIGERAAGLGGAYTALANDSSALWYNPAGLARIKDFHLNVSANTYSYLQTKTEGYFQLPKQGGSESIDMNESDFSVVANTLIFGKKLGDNQAISFGIIIPYTDTLFGSMGTKASTGPSGVTVSINNELNLSSNYYVGMFGYGVQATPSLNIGASLGLGYYQAKYKQSQVYLFSTTAPTWEQLNVSEFTFDDKMYTLQAGLGVQYDISKNQKVGLYVQSPTYRLSETFKYKNLSYSANSGGFYAGDSWDEGKKEMDPYKQVLPGFVSLGYGYEKPGSFGFSLDVIPIFPVTDDGNSAKNAVVNVKTGIEAYLADSVIIRTGLFTDFSQRDDVKNMDSNGSDKINYYGGALSLSLGKHFNVNSQVKKGNATLYTSSKNTLWSTFGIIGRYGVGDAMTTSYDASYNPFPVIKQKEVINIQAFIAESVAF